MKNQNLNEGIIKRKNGDEMFKNSLCIIPSRERERERERERDRGEKFNDRIDFRKMEKMSMENWRFPRSIDVLQYIIIYNIL